MFIHAIGCDIVKISRIKRLLAQYGDKFCRRILTFLEQTQFAQISNTQVQANFLAKRFAAKEAYAKAWGCGIGEEMGFLDIEVANDAKGRPYFSANSRQLLRHRTNVHLSLSDDADLALAYVIIEKLPNEQVV